MVRTNLKKFMAFAIATCMVAGSSVTAFATPGTGTGTGTYEGNDVNFAAATTLTVPTAPTTGFAYIADPNGLIRESASAKYTNSTWADTAKGLFFKTSTDTSGTVYSEKSAALSVVNNNASPIVVSAKVKQNQAGSVVFTDDATFGGDNPSNAKSIYIAVTDGTTTKAIKAGGAEVELPIAVAGKVGNYALTFKNNAYSYELKDGVATTDASKWNSTSFYVTGFLNENAVWNSTTDATITFPTIDVTWDVTAGAIPLKVKAGQASETSLTHAPDTATTISKITCGGVEITADVVSRTNQSGTTPGKISVTAAQATTLYEPLLPFDDGLVLDIEYADGYTESAVIFAR